MRRALLVADSGNNRIQIFDPQTWQLLGSWSDPEVVGTPWGIACDEQGYVYVADHANQRVQKLDVDGRVVASFWEAVSAGQEVPSQPIEVAVAREGGEESIYVLDAGRQGVFVYDTQGRHKHSFGMGTIGEGLGLASGSGKVYVGDNTKRRILAFTAGGTFLGEAYGYRGPVAALALDGSDGLLVHPGGGYTPLRLAEHGACVSQGFAWGGPFRNPGIVAQEWHVLSADAVLAPGSHVQLFVFEGSTDRTGKPPKLPPGPPSGPPWGAGAVDLATCLNDGECEGRWLKLPADTMHGVVPAVQHGPEDPARPGVGDAARDHRLEWVWFGVELTSTGASCPSLSQVRIDFDHETYLRYLPAIYQEKRGPQEFLERYLALLESMFRDVEQKIEGLDRLIDPRAVTPGRLPWLAEWLGLALSKDWDDAQLREAITAAFESYGWRGTARGLRQAVLRYTGADIRIEEPLLQTNWWSLADEDSTGLEAESAVLGFATVLAPAEPQGAVLGTSAVLDGSHLITHAEYGAPLFMDVAHRFTVQMYRGATFSEQVRNDVRAVLDREKPAHTVYHLCVVEPTMRVGFQARVGVDAIVAGPATPTGLEDKGRPSAGLVLGGEPPGYVGAASQLGQTTRLGAGATPH
jgi:phage tail-like protein